MKKKVIILVIILAIVLVIAGVVMKLRKHEDSGLATIKVNEVTRSVFYAPQYVAIHNGYFEENGMEIELTTGQGAEPPFT